MDIDLFICVFLNEIWVWLVYGKLGTLATLIKKAGSRKIKPLHDAVVN